MLRDVVLSATPVALASCGGVALHPAMLLPVHERSTEQPLRAWAGEAPKPGLPGWQVGGCLIYEMVFRQGSWPVPYA